jgi:hypothetical protein
MNLVHSFNPVQFLRRLPIIARVLLLAFLFTGVPSPLITATSHAQSVGGTNNDGSIVGVQGGTSDATGKFLQLQGSMKTFAVVILLIMLVVAAVMAAFQKTGMAISIVIAAVILFGGVYILALFQKGLQ